MEVFIISCWAYRVCSSVYLTMRNVVVVVVIPLLRCCHSHWYGLITFQLIAQL